MGWACCFLYFCFQVELRLTFCYDKDKVFGTLGGREIVSLSLYCDLILHIGWFT